MKQLVVGLSTSIILICCPLEETKACSLNIVSSPVTIVYDPFSNNGATVQGSIEITRLGNANEKPQSAAVVLIKPDAWQMLQLITPNASNSDVSYIRAEIPAGLPNPIYNPGNRQITVRWAEPTATDSVSVPFTIIVPPSVPLRVGANELAFSARYACTNADGTYSPAQNIDIIAAVRANVDVKSAARAYFNGELSNNSLIFDFGEIGNLNSNDVQVDPRSYTREARLNVQSSGSYTLAVTSQNGYRLALPGGSTADPRSTVSYRLTIGGSARSGLGDRSAFTRLCAAAGVVTVTQIPVSVSLAEGGAGKLASPVYSDELTITITPEILGTGGIPCQ